MRKRFLQLFTVCFMLASLLFGSFGTFLFYAVSDSENRNDVRERLKSTGEEGLFVLSVSLGDLANKTIFQQQEEDEIIYKGLLYDVVKKCATRGGMVFYCIHDRNEENLKAGLNEQVKTIFDHSPSGKSGSKTGARNILPHYIGISPFDLASLNITTHFSFSSYKERVPETVYCDIYTPPPALA